MSNGRRLSRGDNRRNARLRQLRQVLPREHAVRALDLADDKRVFALTDHDSRVLARRTVRCRSWQLGEAIEWGRVQAVAAGFAGVTLVCEPTGHRWKVVDRLAATAGIVLVRVQPLLVHRAREAEDFTRDKSDDKDAPLIARLAAQLHVYLPERADPTWARLRAPGRPLSRRRGGQQDVVPAVLLAHRVQQVDAECGLRGPTSWAARAPADTGTISPRCTSGGVPALPQAARAAAVPEASSRRRVRAERRGRSAVGLGEVVVASA